MSGTCVIAREVPTATISQFRLDILLIDSCSASRERLMSALTQQDRHLVLDGLANIAGTAHKLYDLIIFSVRSNSSDGAEIKEFWLRQSVAHRDVPVAVIADAEHDYLKLEVSKFLGVRGHFTNPIDPAVLAGAIRLICAGGSYMLPERLPYLSHSQRSLSLGLSAGRTWPHELTTREVDVLRLLNQGKPNKLIAHELGISIHTAKIHVRNILRKLNATNRTQAVASANPQQWRPVP